MFRKFGLHTTQFIGTNTALYKHVVAWATHCWAYLPCKHPPHDKVGCSFCVIISKLFHISVAKLEYIAEYLVISGPPETTGSST